MTFVMTNDELPTATIFDWMRIILNRRWRRSITGDSMLPLLQDGDVVLVDPHAYQRRSPMVGDIVVAQHPYRTDLTLIKRITAVYENGRFYLSGDNPQESSDSRTFGAVPASHIIGRVTHRLS